MTSLVGAVLLIAILVLLCGVGLGVWGVDSRDGRDWQELLPRRG
ncbi:MAG TPA: hypothetical protein VH989_02625 [Actinomycetota bacterium]|jgi:hypothetical protein